MPTPPRSASPVPARTVPCPCGKGGPYAGCCGPLHRGRSAAGSPEQLMRSRYCAFVLRDEAYLLRTWHPRTRPASLALDDRTQWLGLEVLAATDGGTFGSGGTVEFRARYREGGRPGELRERSRFVRHEGAWVYVDGDIEG